MLFCSSHDRSNLTYYKCTSFPEQILFYAIDHTEDDIFLIHSDFLPILSQIKGRIDTVKEYLILNEDDSYEYEKKLSTCSDKFDFPEFNENTIVTTLYTTGTMYS